MSDHPNFRPATRTPLTAGQARVALGAAWRTHTGEDASRETVALLVAQWALETGWGKAMFNNNFAGIKAKEVEPHTYYTTTEELAPESVPHDPRIKVLKTISPKLVRVRVSPEHEWCRFRHYDDAGEGAVGYVEKLHQRFPRAIPALLAGDASRYATALKMARYFTAPLDDTFDDAGNRIMGYRSNLVSIQRSVLRNA